MPTFRQGDVVRVPFPFTDREARRHESPHAQRLGTLPGGLWQEVEATLRNHLGFD
jgi:hypothetical protein